MLKPFQTIFWSLSTKPIAPAGSINDKNKGDPVNACDKAPRIYYPYFRAQKHLFETLSDCLRGKTGKPAGRMPFPIA